MKNIYTLVITCLLSISAFAQAPEKMSYQAVVRDAANNLVASSSVGMQISILQGSPSGTAVYVETQTPTSNTNGLVTIEIGGGTLVSGDFSTIDWANGPYYIQTETDPTGSTSYTISGTSQLLSVPYALHAETAQKVLGASNFDFNNPYGMYINRVFVNSGNTYNANPGEILGYGFFGNYSYSYTALQDEFIRIYRDNPNITWISHDLSLSDYTVPNGKIFVSNFAPWCTNSGGGDVWTMANSIEALAYTSGYVYPASTIISFDSGTCASAPSATNLTGYLIDEF